MEPRIVYVCLYLLVDLVYLSLSLPYYRKAGYRIQGGVPSTRDEKPMRYVLASALFAYAVLGLGWYLFAAPTALAWARSGMRPWVAGALAGGMYGLVIYAVYNWTLYAWLARYEASVALRDTLWGTFWGAAVTALYCKFVAP